MLWVVLEVALVLGVLVLLGALAWRLWGSVKALGRAVAGVTDVLDAAAPGLEVRPAPPSQGRGPTQR